MAAKKLKRRGVADKRELIKLKRANGAKPSDGLLFDKAAGYASTLGTLQDAEAVRSLAPYWFDTVLRAINVRK